MSDFSTTNGEMKFIKPESGSTFWGNGINENFDKIDERLSGKKKTFVYENQNGFPPNSEVKEYDSVYFKDTKKEYTFISGKWVWTNKKLNPWIYS